MAERLLQDKEGEGDKKRKRNKKGALGVQKYDNKDKDGTLCFFSLNVYVCVCVFADLSCLAAFFVHA